MTVEVVERENAEVHQFAVLRRAKLSVRDAAIVREVARSWSAGRCPSYAELMERLHISSLSVLSYRLGISWTVGAERGTGLIQRGWLAHEGQTRRTLRPGPRFAGLDHGWPLERIA